MQLEEIRIRDILEKQPPQQWTPQQNELVAARRWCNVRAKIPIIGRVIQMIPPDMVKIRITLRATTGPEVFLLKDVRPIPDRLKTQALRQMRDQSLP